MSNATLATKNVLADLTPGDRKKELVKKLRQMKATSVTNAAALSDLDSRFGCERGGSYALVSGTAGKAGSSPTCLMATDYVKVIKSEEGLAAYLTKSGISTDFSEKPFVIHAPKVKEKPTKAASKKPAEKKATPAKPKAKKAKKTTVAAVADSVPVEVEATVA